MVALRAENIATYQVFIDSKGGSYVWVVVGDCCGTDHVGACWDGSTKEIDSMLFRDQVPSGVCNRDRLIKTWDDDASHMCFG